VRRAQQTAGTLGDAVRVAARPVTRSGFPYRGPTAPKGVEVPREPSRLGANYETGWARSPLARAARGLIVEGPLRLAIQAMATPEIRGLDRLADLTRMKESPPVIFAPNHHSHIDTGLLIRAIPMCWRRELIVAAAADYFFDAHWKAVASSLALNAIPIDREAGSRATADQLRDLVADGHSLIIYPEGGRSPDGWGQEFKGGAAYLAARTDVPVVPVFIDGTGEIYGKGAKRLRPGRTAVLFGSPLFPSEDENTRQFNRRIETAVTRLGDEALTDWWTASRRAAAGTNPSLSGPDHNGWRRHWELSERRKLGSAGIRRRQKRRWPDLR
jgi:1-acyl-sn-glycerol-3-phosphate acyltransferase